MRRKGLMVCISLSFLSFLVLYIVSRYCYNFHKGIFHDVSALRDALSLVEFNPY